MRTNMFIKTFVVLLVSFSAVFLFSVYMTNMQLASLSIDENISAVTEVILSSAPAI